MHKHKTGFSTQTLQNKLVQVKVSIIPNKHAPTDQLIIRCPESGVLDVQTVQSSGWPGLELRNPELDKPDDENTAIHMQAES